MFTTRFGDEYGHLGSFLFERREESETVRLVKILPSQDRDSVIRVNILEHLQPETSAYDALSYAWLTASDSEIVLCEPVESDESTHGNSDTDSSDENSGPVLDKRRILTINIDLAEAIRCLRKHDQERLLWVDALCVRNGDHGDVGQQLSLTGPLYSNARYTFLWIGSLSTFTNETVKLLENLRMATDEVEKLLENKKYIKARVDKSQSALELLPRLGSMALSIISDFEKVVSKSSPESWAAFRDLVGQTVFER